MCNDDLAVGLEKVNPACETAKGVVEVASARVPAARALPGRCRGAAVVDYYQMS